MLPHKGQSNTVVPLLNRVHCDDREYSWVY